MLQQTRVDTVVPYYERFLERWPTVGALAAADADDVRASWSGLGYYRRAQLMMRAAATIVRDHAGTFPESVEAIAALPGLGRYTTGAVASIAYDAEVPAVDGNVLRVLARLEGIEGDVTHGEPNRSVWRAAEELARGGATGDLNQGLIELGALICTPKRPDCGRCPVASDCEAYRDGSVDRIPPPKKRAVKRAIEATALLHLDGDRVLLERQPEAGLFARLWCLPMLEGRLTPDGIADEAQRKYGWELSAEIAAEVKHVLTHRELSLRIAVVQGELTPSAAMIRASVERLPELAIPSLTARALRAALPRRLLAIAKLPGRTAKSAQRELPFE